MVLQRIATCAAKSNSDICHDVCAAMYTARQRGDKYGGRSWPGSWDVCARSPLQTDVYPCEYGHHMQQLDEELESPDPDGVLTRRDGGGGGSCICLRLTWSCIKGQAIQDCVSVNIFSPSPFSSSGPKFDQIRNKTNQLGGATSGCCG